MAADEDRAGVAHAPGKRLGIGCDDLEMLGREPIDERQRIFETFGR